MSVKIGKITGSEVRKNRDSGKLTRILQVQFDDPEDIQSVELQSNDGEDSNPIDGTSCVVIQSGPANRLSIAVDDNITPSVDKGEKKIYSYVTGAIKAFLYLLKTGEIRLANDQGSIKIMPDGKIQLRGTGDFAVGFNSLNATLTAHGIALTSHFHSGVTTGGGNSGPSTTPLNIDISGAKKTNIEMEV